MNDVRTGQNWKIAAIRTNSCALYILIIKRKSVCMNDIVNLLKKEIKCALIDDEVPVACVITRNDTIIASSHNSRIKDCNPLAHAEIKCICSAAKYIKSWNLSECVLYVTLEPCKMCKEVISECRIKKVFYFTSTEKKVNDKVKYYKIDDNNTNYFSNTIKAFFVDKR